METEIIEFINKFIAGFNNYAEKNQVIAGAISLWGLGVLSYFGRNIPRQVWAVIIRQVTTTMVLMSSSPTFYNFQTWFYEKGYSDKARAIKISSGRWGDNTAVKSMGYGNHYFFHKYIPFKIQMVKVDATNNLMERDELTITVMGRSHKFFDFLFKEIEKNILRDGKVQVFKFYTDYWRQANNQRKRNIDTIFLEEESKRVVLEHIDNFIAKEAWYVNNGLSYQTGILFYGYPGCGKTSFIKAIASKYNKPIYILSAGALHYIDKAVLELPENALLLIEDIDTDPVLHKRSDPEKQQGEAPATIDPIEFSFTNLSDVLNSLDGIIAIHGRLLIATTNHIEKLDSALLRNGRFDLKIKIGYASKFIIESFFKRYYPDFVIDSNFRLADKVPASTIQNLILKNLENPKEVLKKVKESL